mmetsp:Transcript_35399/g.92134  ORF Transcript_35399/g.92134 Transcript_35399/m.92134 type:complete len:524 (+) Transcript_35399:167-1738(+)
MGIPRPFFVHKDRLSEEIICPVCMEVPLNLVRTYPCQHIFCDACLRSWMKEKMESCPQCRAPLTPSQIQRDRILNNILNMMDVECGLCHEWKGKYNEYPVHKRRCQRAQQVAALPVRSRSRKSSDNDSLDSPTSAMDGGNGDLFSTLNPEKKLVLSRFNPVDYIAYLWWILSGSKKTARCDAKSRVRQATALIQCLTWLPYFVVAFAYGTGSIQCEGVPAEQCGSFTRFLYILFIIALPMFLLSYLLGYLEKGKGAAAMKQSRRGTTVIILFPAVHMFVVIVLLHGTSHVMRMFVFFSVTLGQNAVVAIQRFCCAMTDGRDDPMEVMMWTNFFSTAAVSLAIIGGISGDVKYAVVFFFSFGLSLSMAVVFALIFRERSSSKGAIFYAGAIGSYVGAIYGTSLILDIPLPYHSWLDILFRLVLAVFSFSIFVILPIRPTSATSNTRLIEAFRIPASKSQLEWFANDFRLSKLGFWLLAATYAVLAYQSGVISGPLLVLLLAIIASVAVNTEPEVKRWLGQKRRW